MSRYTVIETPEENKGANPSRYSIVQNSGSKDDKSEAYQRGYEIGLKQAENRSNTFGGPLSFIGNMGAGIGQGATFGWGDEFGSALSSVPSLLTDKKDFKDSYRENLDFARGRADALRTQSPVATGLGEVVGLVGVGGKLGGRGSETGLLPRIGQGISGGTAYGSGVSESPTVEGVVEDTLPYAAMGGIAPTLMYGVGGLTKGIQKGLTDGVDTLGRNIPIVKDIYNPLSKTSQELTDSVATGAAKQISKLTTNKQLEEAAKNATKMGGSPTDYISGAAGTAIRGTNSAGGIQNILSGALTAGGAALVNPMLLPLWAAGRLAGAAGNKIPFMSQGLLASQMLGEDNMTKIGGILSNMLEPNKAGAATTQDDLFHKQSRSPNQYLPRKDPNEELFDRNPIPVDDVPEFKIFDLNNDGVIDGDEYRKFKDQRKKPAPPSSPPPERWDDNDDPSQPPPGHKLGRLPSNTLGPLNTNEIRVYLNTLGERESSNDYGAVNKFGYLGRYQMGLAALEDAGLIKEGTFKQARERGINPNKMLNDPEVWTVKGGKSTFLKDNTLQDRAMFKYTERNLNGLKRAGVIDSDTAKDEVAGYLATAHLKGVGGAKNLAKGIVTKDGFGTTTDEYFNLAKNAFRKDS